MMEPAKTITDLVGGVKRLAELAECSESVARRFAYRREQGGNGGLIPTQRANVLLRNARAAGIDLRPDHFFPSDIMAANPVPATPSEEGAAA